MKAVSPNAAVWFALVGFVTYWVLAAFVPGPVLKDIFDSLALGVAVTIAITWQGAAWRAFKEGATEGEWQLVIAVFLLWVVLIMQRIYSIWFTFMGRPDWITQSPIPGFMAYSIMLAGILFLTSAGLVDEERPRRYLWHIVFAIGLGCLVAGVVIGFALDNSEVLEPLIGTG